MRWQKERDRWLRGQIDSKVDFDAVDGWLRSDPIWAKYAQMNFTNTRGSHFVVVRVPNAGEFLPQWTGDKWDVSHCDGGKKVKKYLVEQLVKMYNLLERLENQDK